VVATFTDTNLAHAIKIVGVSDDTPRVADCETASQEALEGRASGTRSQPYYLDVTHPQANKGAVVETLARLAHISPSDVAAIGDGPNDVLMFGKSGFSIAMGNASREVKAQAQAGTDDNENEGFAKAMRKYVLAAAAA
jgi:hydroxymethylpyrimidine pyrophosphatase-like HAD family hydrolase